MNCTVDNQNAIIAKLMPEITCSLCLDIYSNPKRLPCDHIYCSECLKGMASRDTLKRGMKGHLRCPECRRDLKIPEGDVDKLPTSHQVRARGGPMLNFKVL